MTLSEMHTGQYGRIISVGGYGPLRRRLMDMGLTPGTAVYVRKVAPLGDPIEIFLRGYEFTLRKEDAARITVTIISREDFDESFICARRQSKQWKNHAFQPAHRQQPACRKFPRGHGRKKRGRGKKA